MNKRLFGILALWLVGSSTVSDLFAESNPMPFHAAVLWESNTEKGVLLVNPTEMWVIDSSGQKYAKVTSREAVLRVYMSPDTKKLAYTTAAGVWFVKLDTGESSQVASGECNFFRWDSSGMGLLFSIDYYGNGNVPPVVNTKLFWADGDGKNLKQVYP